MNGTGLGMLLGLSIAGLGVTDAAQPGRDEAVLLLESAIRSGGGAEHLERFPALTWRGRATVHAGGREIQIEGWWRLVPPDRAVVETREVGRGESSLRRLILSGDRGWTEREGQAQALAPEFTAHERDQFYLYYLMRFVPLRSPDFQLVSLGVDASGSQGIRVSRAGRRDVDLYFDAAKRLVRVVTRLTDPGTGKEVVEELRCSGVLEARGIRWPKRIAITWDGLPYFDFELTEFKPMRRLDESLFKPAK